MLPYYKKYAIYVCICAVLPTIMVSTIWPFITGQIMAASLGGLALLFALFIIGLIVGYSVFSKRAEAKTEELLDLYNEDCDPSALVKEAAWIMNEMQLPLNDTASWFAGYYAQALLDIGDKERATTILNGMMESASRAKNDYIRCSILSNMLPLEDKIEGDEAALSTVGQALELCSKSKKANETYRDFLLSQKAIYEAIASGDQQNIASLSEGIRSNASYPMRIRIEYAWKAANAFYKLGDISREKSELRFISKNGGSLVLRSKAQERLAKLTGD